MKAKNFTTLDTAAADLEWPVYVAGADIDPNGKAVEMRHTRMLGTIASAELSALLAAAPICALPSRYEPFGLCALEAALSGCALVLGDIRACARTGTMLRCSCLPRKRRRSTARSAN